MPPLRVLVTTMVAASVLSLGACDGKKPTADGANPPNTDPPADTRKPIVPTDHPLHGRLEGTGPDACSADGGCFVGGCSSEVCSAEQGVITTCEAFERPGWPADAACGCVSGSCQWWSASGGTLGDGGGPTPGGTDCGGAICEAPRECITYYGIAGPSGPEFKSCEIQCKLGKGCPDGMSCVTIADGPGQVCRESTEATP